MIDLILDLALIYAVLCLTVLALGALEQLARLALWFWGRSRGTRRWD